MQELRRVDQRFGELLVRGGLLDALVDERMQAPVAWATRCTV